MITNFFKINDEELEKQIFYYKKLNGIDPKYLIVNENTLKLLETITYSYLFSNKNENNYGTYWGIPIALCNKLKDGEVDIIYEI
jgi:hypothetical protein